jgi:signal transduction histidine kinase
MAVRVLLIEDNPFDRELAARALAEIPDPPGPIDVATAGSWAAARPILDAGGVDLVVLDYYLPDRNGLAIVCELAARPRHPPIVILTGQNDLMTAVELLRSGAADYVPKAAEGWGPALRLAVERTIERVRLEAEVAESRERLAAYARELEGRVAARTEALEAQAAQFEALYLKAEEAARVKEVIVANVSHELRTPLNVVLGYVELLEDHLRPDDAEGAGYLRKLQAGGLRLLQVIESILTLGDLRAGRMGVAVARFRLAGLVEELRVEAALTNRDKGLQIEWQVEEERHDVEHDREKLRAIASHLLGNAIKFTDRGRIVITLAPTDGGGVRLSVADTGVGLPLGVQAVILEDFRQLDGSSTRRYEGLGLGLGIVRRYTALLGGTLRVDGTPGRGTTVVVELPPVATAAARSAASSTDPGSPPPP